MGTKSTNKGKFLSAIAEANGVAVVVLDSQRNEIAAANNNSICRTLWGSKEFGPDCARDCGTAFAKTSNGETLDFECHAGLSCRAIPVEDHGRRYVTIVGRTFLKAEGYRKATERAIVGQWSVLKPTEFFENVLMSSSDAGIEGAAEALAKFTVSEPEDLLEIERPSAMINDELSEMVRRFNESVPAEVEVITPDRSTTDASEIRSLVGSLMRLNYRDACGAVLDFLADHFEFQSLIWLERTGDRLAPLVARGVLQGKPIRINLSTNNERLAEASRLDQPLVLRERSDLKAGSGARSLSLFPSKVGSEIRSAIAIENDTITPSAVSQINRLSKAVSPQIEILRLRNEVSYRDMLEQGLRKFNEHLGRVDAEDFWLGVTQASAELLGAERASLLILDEATNNFKAKAAFGSAIDLSAEENIGGRIARRAIERGSPLTVADLAKLGIDAAPSEWRYRSDSFISYPLTIGTRRFGVMSFTDRVDGAFTSRDVELLNMIAPQVAMAIDRTRFRSKAIEFEQRSLTDALTGLRNRGYLEERLTEEISQARRYRSSMCLLMIDVDNFKSYNDSFGHPAGDAVLKLVATAFRETLRTADVAARYGGEEFAILLPHTSLEEAAIIAERIRQRVEHMDFPHRRVTISVGLAGYSNEFGEPKDWVDAADVALYEVKESGRNGIQIYERMGRSFREKIN